MIPRSFFFLPLLALAFSGCNKPATSGGKLTVGVAFETLQTEYWVAGFEAIKAELAKRDMQVLEAVADQDANRQLQQVKNFIARKVDGIILVPKDAKTCIPMIKAANEAGIPIVLFNRPADKSDAKSVAVDAQTSTANASCAQPCTTGTQAFSLCGLRVFSSQMETPGRMPAGRTG